MKSVTSDGDVDSDVEDPVQLDAAALLEALLGELEEMKQTRSQSVDVSQSPSAAATPGSETAASEDNADANAADDEGVVNLRANCKAAVHGGSVVLHDSGRGTMLISGVSDDSGVPASATASSSRSHSYRMSRAVLEDSHDVDLDDILAELGALENHLSRQQSSAATTTAAASCAQPVTTAAAAAVSTSCQSRKSSQHLPLSTGATRPRLAPECAPDTGWGQRPAGGAGRTDSPDNDSAFSDTVSMLSGESSASSGLSATRTEVSESSSGVCSTTSPTSQSQRPEDTAVARPKADKIKLALEKIREANIKKLFVKVFCDNGATKSLMVDETMTVAHVCQIMAQKKLVELQPRLALVEYLPALLMERVYEDHESVVDNLTLWLPDSKNQLFFLERPDKCDLFSAPHIILADSTKTGSGKRESYMSEHSKVAMIEEFFGSLDCNPVPHVESELWLKSEGKKTWKKYHFTLRASGVYYSPKGPIHASKDLVCLATFDLNQVYHGIDWRRKYKAPTDYCLAIKHPQIQTKAPKHIRYLCADDPTTLRRWIMGIRIAKSGRRLLDNHRRCLNSVAPHGASEGDGPATRAPLGASRSGVSFRHKTRPAHDCGFRVSK